MKHMIMSAIAASTVAMLAAEKGSGSGKANAEVPPVPPAPPVAGEVPPAPPVAGEATSATPKVKQVVFGITDAVPMPDEDSSRSKYPFDELKVNQSFGVAGRDKKSFNSIIYAAQQRHAVAVLNEDGTPKTKMKEVKNKDGSKTNELVPEKNLTRKFVAYDVDPAKDPEGATVRIYRIA